MCCHSKATNNNGMTVHHSIPQREKPKDNVLIPVCLACHRRINDKDIKGLKGQLHAAVNHLKRTFQKVQGVTTEDVVKIKYKGKNNGNR